MTRVLFASIGFAEVLWSGAALAHAVITAGNRAGRKAGTVTARNANRATALASHIALSNGADGGRLEPLPPRGARGRSALPCGLAPLALTSG
jgi:hypothetical protein